MDIHVRLFAMLRDAAGTDACRLTLEPTARSRDAKTALSARYPALARLLPYARCAINREYQSWETALNDGDELALIPPVSGG